MTALENFVSPALMRALGWTLLHSLWQGALVAAVLAGALLLLRRQRAEVRYVASAGALVVVVALAGITFGLYFSAGTGQRMLASPGSAEAGQHQLAPERNAATVGAAPVRNARPGAVEKAPPAAQAAAVAETVPTVTPVEWLATGLRYFDRHLPLLVVAWLLGLLAMSLRLLGGLLYVQRLRRYRVRPLAAAWQERLAVLAARSGLRRPVALLESALVRVPLVVGHVRPVILLPLGAVAGLPPAYLEAILAHELAHVLRRDYLVNFLQTVAEAVFFYHPAVWFMASCVRTERENCCDDTATALVGGDPLRLARALTALAEWSHSAVVPAAPRLALAAVGRRGALLGRVRRLVLRRPAPPTLAEGLLAGALVLGGLGLLGGSMALAGPLAARLPLSLTPNNKNNKLVAEQDTTKQRAKKADAVPAPAAGSSSSEMTLPAPARMWKNTDMTVTGPDRLPGAETSEAGVEQAPPGVVVITRDKKGRLTDLVVNGQRVEPAKISRVERRAGRQVTVVPLPPVAAARSMDGRMNDESWELDQKRSRKMRKAGEKLDKAVGPGPDRRHPNNNSIHIDIDDAALNRLVDNAVALGNVSLNIGLQAAAQGMEEARRELEATLRDPRLNLEARRATQQALRELKRAKPRRAADEVADGNRQQELRDRQQEDRDQQQATRDRQQELQDRQQELRDRQQEGRDRQQELQNRRQELQDRIRESQQELRDLEQDRAGRGRQEDEALVAELLKDGLIKDRENFQLKLTVRSLVVDDKEQPRQVFQKYLQRYESTNGRKMSATGSMVINRSGSSSTESRLEPPAPPRPVRAPRAPSMGQVPAPPPLGPAVLPRPPRAPGVDAQTMRNELRKDGLIGPDDKGFQVQLNAAGFTVNGKRQPEEVAAKYRRLTNHDDGKSFNMVISSQE